MIKNVANTSLGHTGTTVSFIVAATVLDRLAGHDTGVPEHRGPGYLFDGQGQGDAGLLGLLHGNFATPHGGIVVLTLLSAAIGVYCATPYNVDNITQITLASNTGTFLVYGMTCVVAVVAFAERHDKHILKHMVVPILGALMNIAELIGVVYLAVTAGGATSKDTYKALAIVGVWIVAGFLWVTFNPNKHHAAQVHAERGAPKSPAPAAPVEPAAV